MPFDGIFAGKITEELQQAVLCHIDKIYQPSYDALVFLLRKKDFSARLLLCARSGAARVQFTEIKQENPAEAPLFCMLARKYFSGAKITAVEQINRDRIIRFRFETTDEMGDRVFPQIFCELTGAAANIVMVGGNGKIIDALHRSDPATAKRLLQPGARYELPPAQNKQDPLNVSPEQLAGLIIEKKNQPLTKALLDTVDGISPLVCREIAEKAFGEDRTLGTEDWPRLAAALREWQTAIKNARPILLRKDGLPTDYTYTEIAQYGKTVTSEPCQSYGKLLDGFYAERDSAEHLKRTANDMLGACKTARARILRRREARKQDLLLCRKKENYRIYGELLKANLYRIESGSAAVTVQNYYDEQGDTVTIALDPKLSPAQNAAKYFKEYKKSRTALQTLDDLIAEDGRELDYLETVLDSITRCETAADFSEIRAELQDAGYLSKKQKSAKRMPKSSPFREYKTPSGFRLLVGKNNRQNDELTLRIADKSDWWFHVKGGAGSHTVLFAANGTVTDEDFLTAAEAAAYFSSYTASAQVPVDYTRVRHVKKPNGAKPGMVIYTDQKTLYVTPKEPQKNN